MVFTIQRDVVLLCAGEPPSSGPDDARFVVPGDKTFPPVKVWPGFKLLMSVLFGKNIKINVICAVRESENGPVYICSVDGLDDFSNEFLSVGGGSLRCVGSSMTGVVRELFSFLCQDEQKVPGQIKGPHFFGLRSKSVSAVLDAAVFPGKKAPSCSCQHEGESDDVIIDDVVTLSVEEKYAAMIKNAKVRWNGITAAGLNRFVDNSAWSVRQADGTQLVVRDGFSATREVLTTSGTWVTVLLKVYARNNESVPFYECSAELDEGKVVVVGSHLASSAARQILAATGAITTHHWSYDFFGFHLSTVRALFSDTVKPPKKRPCNRKQTCPIIVRIQKIRDWQGGPTSSLLREESKDSRNAFISEVVSYLSFEDVKSKFSLQRKARCTPGFYKYMACKYIFLSFFDVDEARYPTMVELFLKKKR